MALESDSDKDKRHAISVLARGAFKSRRLALIHGGADVARPRSYYESTTRARARILHLYQMAAAAGLRAESHQPVAPEAHRARETRFEAPRDRPRLGRF